MQKRGGIKSFVSIAEEDEQTVGHPVQKTYAEVGADFHA
jgi:hypothetical protein